MVAFFIGGDLPPEERAHIIQIGGRIMIWAACFQWFEAFGSVYTGAMRGAGDTRWPSGATIIYSWLFIVAGGWLLAVYVPQWESIGPWAGAATFIILYGVTMFLRFESGGWRKIKLLDTPAEEAAEHAPVGPTPPAATPDASIRDITDVAGHDPDYE